MFLIISSRRRRIQHFFRSFSAFFIVHLHVLALVRLSERGVFCASPPLPSLPPSSAGSLGAPIAFPIFRPPMVSVHRQKTQEKPAAVDLHSPLFHNYSTIEERFATSGAASSLSSSIVEEDDDNLSHQQREEEELAFSPVPIFSFHKVNNASINSNNSASPVAFHRLDAFGVHRNGKDGTDLTMAASTLLSTPPTNRRIGSNSAAPFSTIQTTAHHVPHTSDVPRSSIAPQFPVFTGMGMEIIESGESEGGRSATNAAGENVVEDRWHSLQQKMHYNFTNDSKSNSRNLMNGVQPKKVTGASPRNNGSIEQFLNGEIATTTRASSTVMPSIRIEPITKEVPIGSNTLGHLATMGVLGNSTQPMATAEEVTEDLLALFSSTSGPLIKHEHSPKNPSSNATVGEHGLAPGQHIGGDSSSQTITKLPTVGPDEEIIPRPTTVNTHGNEQMAGQSWPQTTWPTTRQQIASSSTTMAATAGEPTTHLPTTVTTIGMETTQAKMTRTTTVVTTTTELPKITIETEHFVDGGDIHTELTGRRITIGTKSKTQTTTTIGTPTSIKWQGGNHIEEQVEEVMTTAQSRTVATATPSWNITKQKYGGDKSVQNKKALETSRVSDRSDGSANFRLLVIAGIIALLFIAVGIGSICTGRYVRKSRQLHGKYRPAAYELQTTRPPPLAGSSLAFQPPPNRLTNCNASQQNRHFEFGHMHQMPPPVHFPHHQLTLNGNDGREERLI